MGQWTPDYLDDVLHAKLKNLVSGAIHRSSLEKTDPTINYENFVKDLDTGDSFTTSLVDILVKELAERHTRANLNDRRLIAEKTAKNLRLLATPLRVYRGGRPGGRGPFGRRTLNLSEYLTAPPPNQMDMEEDEDEFESMLDDRSSATLEGARINNELYEAYDSHNWPQTSLIASAPRRINASPSPVSDEGPSVPPPRSGPWSMPPAAATSLTGTSLGRQPSIRSRPSRARTVDFNDYTSRRRSQIRESLGSRHDAEADVRPEARDVPWGRPAQATARRFFRPRGRLPDSASPFPPWTDGPDALGTETADELGSFESHGPVSTIFTFPAPLESFHGTTETETSEERAHFDPPRMHRGGLRVHESMLSRHASPLIMSHTVDHAPVSPPISDHGDHGHTAAEAAGYPTPGSTENDT